MYGISESYTHKYAYVYCMYTYTHITHIHTHNTHTLDNLHMYVHIPCMAGFQTMVLSHSQEVLCKSVTAHVHYANK